MGQGMQFSFIFTYSSTLCLGKSKGLQLKLEPVILNPGQEVRSRAGQLGINETPAGRKNTL